MSGHQTRPCCAICRHFHRDFNRYHTAKQLRLMKAGYCMMQPPKPYLVSVDEVAPRMQMAMFPLVDEDAVFGVFEPRQ